MTWSSRIKWKGLFALAGGFIMHLTIGTLYCWGNLNPYVTSYIRKYSVPHDLRYNGTVWVFAMAMMGVGLTMFIGGLLEKKFGSRLSAFFGCVLTSLGVFLSAFTIKSSYYLFLTTYGFMFGFGVGLTYAPPMNVAMQWFPEYKGLVNGVIVAGFGGGAFIFDFIQTAYLNPNNVQAVNATQLNTTQDIGTDKYFNDEHVLNRVPEVFIFLSGIYFAMQIIGATLLFSPPDSTLHGGSDYEEREALVTESLGNGATPQAVYSDEKSYHPLEMIRTREFITLWLMFVFNTLVVIFVSTLYKTYGESEVVNNDKILTAIGAVSSVFNSGGRVIWGLYADKVSFKAAIVTLNAAMTILMSSLYITHLVSESAGAPLLFIWICAIFFSFSGNFSLFPTACAKTFGPKYRSINYGLLFTSSAVAGPVAALLSTFLLSSLHSYGLFILAGSLSLISMILGLTFNGKLPNGKQV